MRSTDERPSLEAEKRAQRSKAGGNIVAIGGSVFALGVLYLVLRLIEMEAELPTFLILALALIGILGALIGAGMLPPEMVVKAVQWWKKGSGE